MEQEPIKYFSCDLIEHGFDLNFNSINFCCRTTDSGGGYKTLIPNYHGEPINWNDFFEIKNQYRKQMREGNLISECKGCIHLYEKDWDDEDYISHINFNSWIKCNAKCLYCDLEAFHKVNRNPNQYNVLPIIKDLVKKKLLKQDGNITIAGGEPTIIREFEELLNLLLDYGVKDIRLNTNGIKYSKTVEKGLKSGVISLVTSVDAGTKETFKKIKKVNCYDKVWQNIKNYAKAQIKDYQVKAKFIIIPGINHTKEEIDGWLKKSKEADLKYVALDVELNWYAKMHSNIPDNLYELMTYIINKAKEYDLQIEHQDRAFMLLNKMKEKNMI